MIGLGELYTQVRINDPQYFPIIEKCIELKAPVMCHGGDNRKDYREPDRPAASRADDFVEAGHRYPEAMLIYGHIGGGGDWEYVCKTLRSAPTRLCRHQRQRHRRRPSRLRRQVPGSPPPALCHRSEFRNRSGENPGGAT